MTRPDFCRATLASGGHVLICEPCKLTWGLTDHVPPMCRRTEMAKEATSDDLPKPNAPPLTPHAYAWLLTISYSPVVRSAVNPGVAQALERRGYATTINLASPFRTHRGRLIPHSRITEAGRVYLAETGQRLGDSAAPDAL